jgi:hypothetical protein
MDRVPRLDLEALELRERRPRGKEEKMKNCFRCGSAWVGLRGEPRARELCEGCGAYLHSCVNCHHFDHVLTNSCKLPHTSFVGCRDSPNYCEEFKMLNTIARAEEERVSRAKHTWNQLWA